jgi:transcriptional regulator with XRE-family HTH domain
MNLYECKTYKEALKVLTEERKTKRKAVTFEAMADYCGIQKTYLSKVLNKDGNLSADQLFQAAEFLKLNAFESNYLENLYQVNTTQVNSRKLKFQLAIEKARKEILKSENSIKSEIEHLHELATEKYYLDPYYQLIHIFLTIDHYSKNHLEIGKNLNLPNTRLDQYLNDLSDWKIIEIKNGSYKVLKNNLHLPKDSYLNSSFRNFVRQASQNKMNILEQDDFYSFSAIVSCDIETKQKIQKRFLEFLKNCQNDVMKSKSEEVFQINFDLLKWS